VPLAPYATPSTEEVPRSIEKFIETYNAVLLANHGVLALGKDLTEALHRMERVEHLAKVVLVGKLAGNLKVLDREEMGKLKELAKQMGV
jgi:L-fuculose-phosphate aldolase